MRNSILIARIFLAISVLASVPLCAQTAEVGGTIALSVDDVLIGLDPQHVLDQKRAHQGWKFGSGGGEVSLNVSHRYALFAEFSHWSHLGRLRSTTWGLKGADLVSGGVRIRGPEFPGGVRPSMDVGIGGGRYHVIQPGETTLAGYILGGSILLPVGDRWYARPQMRVLLMADKLCLQERLGTSDFPCAFGLGTNRSLIIRSWGVSFGVRL